MCGGGCGKGGVAATRVIVAAAIVSAAAAAVVVVVIVPRHRGPVQNRRTPLRHWPVGVGLAARAARTAAWLRGPQFIMHVDGKQVGRHRRLGKSVGIQL
jgi:hypothetical protein